MLSAFLLLVKGVLGERVSKIEIIGLTILIDVAYMRIRPRADRSRIPLRGARAAHARHQRRRERDQTLRRRPQELALFRLSARRPRERRDLQSNRNREGVYHSCVY